MATRKNKEKNKENTKNKTNNKEQKNKTNKKKYHFQKTKLYKLYLTELEKLKGGGLEEVEKFMGGDWLDNLGIRKLGSLISETIEVPYMLFGASGMFLKQTVEAVWISKIYYWVKENIWENSFIRGFFDIFMKLGGKIGEAIYFIYILLTKIVFDIMEKKLRSVWLWVLTLITTLGVFEWAGSSGMLGSTIGSFLTSSVNGPIINFFNTFNFWNFLGTIITGIFSILGNVWGGVTTFISSYLFFSSFFQVVLVIAILWGLNTLRLDYNKSNPELAELNKHKKLRNTMKNQKESKILSEKENENENEKKKEKENEKENENENENASQRSSVSVSESSTKPKRIVKKRPSKKVLESIPEDTTEENEKEAISVKSFNIPYKEALTDKNMSSFQKLRANFIKNGKVPMPANENGLRGGGGDNGFQNLSTKKLLENLNKISKSTMDVSKESNSMGFQLALFCGFIKETKDGYVFTPHAAKTIKSFIISSHTSIHKNCKGDCKMEEMEEMGEMKEMKEMGGNAKKRTTRKNNEELRTIDLDSVIDTLKAFEFVQTAVVHALVRKSNETTKDERKDERKHENVLQYLKKEDIEWLKERDPEQIKIAIKLGILTSDLELTHISTGIAKDGDIINGISIKEQFEKHYSSVPQ